MAKQIAGLCRFEGTLHGITFYKMDGQYYARAQSSLSSERVKTSEEFKWTMVNARLLARASKIGSQVYKALPPGWRQFWMYRSFTGEAFTLLKEHPYTDEQVKQLLWKCYVEYWEQIKAADPNNSIFLPRPKKIRKRRKYSEASIQRLLHRKDKYGRYKYPEYVKAEKERAAREARESWAKKCKEKKQAAIAAEMIQQEACNHLIPQLSRAASLKFQPALWGINTLLQSYSTWQVAGDGSLYVNENLQGRERDVGKVRHSL